MTNCECEGERTGYVGNPHEISGGYLILICRECRLPWEEPRIGDTVDFLNGPFGAVTIKNVSWIRTKIELLEKL